MSPILSLDTAHSLGPLAKFAGTWSGAGVDWAPGKEYQPPDHEIPIEEHLNRLKAEPYWQEMQLEPLPRLSYSASGQTVTGLRYLGKIWGSKKAEPKDANSYPDFFPVYEENGYVLWIPDDSTEAGTVVRQISNPRGLSFMARADNILSDATEFEVICRVEEDPLYGILQTPHLQSIYYPSPLFKSFWRLDLTAEHDTLYYDEITFLKHPHSNILIPQRDEALLKRYTPKV